MNSALSIIIIAERFNEKKGKIETVKEFHDIFIIDYEKFNNNPFQFLNNVSEEGFLKKNDLNRVLAFYRISKYSLMQKIDGTRMLFESNGLQRSIAPRLIIRRINAQIVTQHDIIIG